MYFSQNEEGEQLISQGRNIFPEIWQMQTKKYIENKHLIKKKYHHVSSGILFRTAYFMSWTIFIPIEYCYATMWAHAFLLV